jgi:hypothetical protein
MPRVIVDTTGVPDSDRTTYEGPTPGKGLYKALWKRGWWTKTKDGKKTMLKVLFILETENAAKKQFNGYPIFHNVTYEPSTMWKMHELFGALRAGEKAAIDYDDKGDVGRIGRAVVGKTSLLIHGKEDIYNGVTRLVVDTLAPLPKPEGEEDEEFMEDGDATPFEEAGGVVASDEPSQVWPSDDDSMTEPPF